MLQLHYVALVVLVVAVSLRTSVAEDGNCIEISRWRELRTTIKEANWREELVFCPFRISKPDMARITVRKPVHVSCEQSKECTIVGKGKHIVVSSTTQDFSVSGLVFVGATETALWFSKTTLSTNVYKVNNCSFRNNHSPLTKKEGRGGAVRVESGANVTITKTNFLDSQAYYGGSIFILGGTVAVSESKFENNLAFRGSSIFVGSRANRVQISTTVFSSNAVPPMKSSGAIHSSVSEKVEVLAGTKGVNNDVCNGLYDASKRQCIPFPDTLIPVAPSIGDLTIRKEGVRFSTGLTARVVARAGRPVVFTSPEATALTSSIPFHMEPDGAAAFSLDQGRGYIYVSNSELNHGQGGVYGLEFDENGYIRDYKPMLATTNRNCNGGKSPWQSWISCEEVGDGHCWQVDPQGKRNPSKTKLGGANGGAFEAFAYDARNPAEPQFFVTEDSKDGALRRFRPPPGATSGWSMLHHDEGVLDYLEFLPGNKFHWTDSLTKGRESALSHFRNSEGITIHEGVLYFVSKVQKELFRLDLDNMTYSVESTQTGELEGGGSFGSGPDHLLSTSGGLLYFTEDGGRTPGVFVYDGVEYKALLEADSPMYVGDETTGIAFSPDRKTLLFCLQESGVCFQVSRIDGRAFDSNHRILEWKYSLHGRRN